MRHHARVTDGDVLRRDRGAATPDRAGPAPLRPRSGGRVGGFAGLSVERLGGPLGTHAGPVAGWWGLDRVLVAVVGLAFALTVAVREPCLAAQYPRTPAPGAVIYTRLCYSDVPLLFRDRGLAQGLVPYLDHQQGNQRLEYPVGTGLVMQATAWVTRLLFGTGGSPGAASIRYYAVNIVLFLVLALVTVLVVARLAGPGRGRDALLVAAAPSMVLATTINWDLVSVCLTVLALLAWARARPWLAGALLGLGAAAKLWPVFLLGPLFLLALRGRRLGPWVQAAVFAALAWLAVNLPFILTVPDQWRYFWDFNQTMRAAPDLGSPWLALSLIGRPLTTSTDPVLALAFYNHLTEVCFAVLCAGIAVLALTSRVRPRVAQLCFLTIVAFTLTGTVYSPQYVLWLLPLAVLARPRWRDILIWQAAEAFYWLAVWWYLGGSLSSGLADQVPWVYVLAIVVRLSGELYLAALVVRDILSPRHDPVRADAVAAARAEPGDPAPAARAPADPTPPIAP